MKVTVFGIGYVGLVQAAILAEVGHNILCIDIDAKKIEDLKKGVIPIFEPGLSPLVSSNYKSGRLNFSTNIKKGVHHGVIQLITVGTPQNKNGVPNLKHIVEVVSAISQYMNDYKVIVNKSTVPVGTADFVRRIILKILKKRNIDIYFDVVSNPEFLKEGAAVNDCLRPERIVIGVDNNRVVALLRKLYEPFNRDHNRIILMDIRSAELTKYAANCMLATRISFMNEISNIAELLGADVEKVREGIGSDSRIGHHFIYPGCGYGGSCFPKDIQTLIRTAESMNYTPHLLQAVVTVNTFQKNKLMSFIKHYFGNDLDGSTFALWGLSFKPNTNDMREASSCILMESLWKEGATVQAFDPEAMNAAKYIYGNRNDLKLMDTKEAVLQDAYGLIICTEWQSFRTPDFDIIKTKLKYPVIFDGRNLYDPERIKKYGFIYYAIGRGESVHKI